MNMHFASNIRLLYTSLDLAMHGMSTLSLATQHEERPEYVNVGISWKNSCKVTTVTIGVDRSKPRLWSLHTQMEMKISWQAIRQSIILK